MWSGYKLSLQTQWSMFSSPSFFFLRHLIPVLLSVTAYKPQTEIDNTPNVRDLNIPHLSCHQESTSVRAPRQSTANHLHYGLMLPDLKANHMHLFPILSSGQCHAARFIKKKKKTPSFCPVVGSIDTKNGLDKCLEHLQNKVVFDVAQDVLSVRCSWNKGLCHIILSVKQLTCISDALGLYYWVSD